MTVAMAAPLSPYRLMNIGHRIILMILAIQRLFIAMAAFPAPLKIPLITKSMMMAMLPPNMILVKMAPSLTTSSLAPINSSISAAYTMPATLSTTVAIMDMIRACAPACAASAGFFSPILLATMAVAAVLKPIASEYTMVMTDSVRPTVAMAFSPSLLTKNMSTTANTLSRLSSSIMGMASRKTALGMLPFV